MMGVVLTVGIRRTPICTATPDTVRNLSEYTEFLPRDLPGVAPDGTLVGVVPLPRAASPWIAERSR